ncbi:PREDICTED: peroxisome biogenesis protein 1 isoform X2 [Ipomoea nil]|uniref:peroxisome biogenesis protein 1 isoform X2 n=1 Tax=Ipomoea nil TaxID=35883 RepID=UPI0009017D67|nr:PREDICTED: peroxisome biogenesis protein 1 isoform X2 [Ipomoea nil]
MEFDVRVAAGIESCFVSLPITFINTLASTAGSGYLPPILALQLRSSHNNLWHVAWSGSASSPPSASSIQIAQQYAECIGLSDGTVVEVRVVSNLPKASMVTIEPDTEDDWEVMELNSELAEQAILKQLSIVYEGMRFPLWLHGQSVIKFFVSSTSPKTPVVQLVPGSEVAIAPKRRKRNLSSEEESSIASDEISITKALLRVQDPAEQCIHKYEGCGDEMEVTLTSAILIHPETANLYSFHSLEVVVIMARSLPKESKTGNQTDKEKTSAKPKEVDGGVHSYNEDDNEAVVRVLFSKSVAKGHVMLPLPLRLYLRASVHSWVFVKISNFNLQKEIPFVSISPCQFKMIEEDGDFGSNEAEVLANRKNHKVRTNSHTNMGVIDWSVHEKIAMSYSYESPSNKNKETKYKNMKGITNVLRAWFLAQIDATTSLAGLGVNSLILGNKTLLHIKVPGNRLIKHGKVQTQNSVPLGSKDGIGEQSVDLFYVLSIIDKSAPAEKAVAYQLVFDEGNDISTTMRHRHMEVLLGKLQLSDGFSFQTTAESLSAKDPNMTVSSLNWMGTAASDVITRLTVLLSPTSGMLFSTYDLPLPGHILIHGPPGCGKTLLATVAAKVLEENEEILAHIVCVSCSKLALEKPSSLRQALIRYISEAVEHAPSIIIFDDLDSIIASSSESDGSQPSSSSTALVQFFADIMDEYEEKRANTCGIGPVAFVASVQTLTSIPQTLSSSGRFDFHIKLLAPAATEREALLRHEINKRSLQCSHDVLTDVASKCDGYDAYDLEILVDRSIHAAVSRILSSSSCLSDKERPTLIKDDFTHAMHEFLPVAMRDITKPSSDGGRTGWEDVGGLNDICNAIKEVRDIFSKAALAAPCLLFFDEFDSIAPKRGHDNTGVTDRVVNQFLTELDGVEVLTGVFVFAATSRPDLLDAALLRPGRLDRLLFCDFPSPRERLDILRVLSRKLPLESNVNLEAIAHITEGLSGADLQALLSDAQLEAVHDILNGENGEQSGKMPVITDTLLKRIASVAKPSVSENEKRRLYDIYSQFLDSKRSVASQSRDAKGKRATLA